jgi:hypothetical protein
MCYPRIPRRLLPARISPDLIRQLGPRIHKLCRATYRIDHHHRHPIESYEAD